MTAPKSPSLRIPLSPPLVSLASLVAAVALASSSLALADSPSASQQFPDLANLPDVTEVLQGRIDENDGALLLGPGVHRITRPLEFRLEGTRSALVRPETGPATLVMDGPGPAIRITGSHEGTAGPRTFRPETWNERMPVVEGIEIVGNHPEADGIALVRTVKAVVSRVAVRWCRHGIHLVDRNRNVTVSDVHLYENQGIGLYLDDVNLHQINVVNSHISYNRGGGIVVRDGNVRNLQITGCDIESNMPGDDTPTTTANILLDVSGTPEDRSRSIAEVAITGCTIQHSSNYGGAEYDSIAPGGANIRLLGKDIYPINMVSITGNVISDTSLNVEISKSLDVALSGNTFFAPNPDNLRVVDSRRVVATGNVFNPRQFVRPGRIVFENSRDCLFANNSLHALAADDAALTVRGSARIQLHSNLLSGSLAGIRIEGSRDVSVRDWTHSGLPEGVPFLSHDEASSAIVESGTHAAEGDPEEEVE